MYFSAVSSERMLVLSNGVPSQLPKCLVRASLLSRASDGDAIFICNFNNFQMNVPAKRHLLCAIRSIIFLFMQITLHGRHCRMRLGRAFSRVGEELKKVFESVKTMKRRI